MWKVLSLSKNLSGLCRRQIKSFCSSFFQKARGVKGQHLTAARPLCLTAFSISPSHGESPLVAHRSERNLLKAVAFFRGVSHKQSGGLFVREGHFFAKKCPYCSYLFAALSASAETNDFFDKRRTFHMESPPFSHFKFSYFAASNACAISAMISSTFSKPTERRIIPASMPAATSCSSVS